MAGGITIAAALLALVMPQSAAARGVHAQAPPLFAQTTGDHPECRVVPVAGFQGVFTVDADSGLDRCAPRAWTPSILFLRGLGNAGIGVSLKDMYLQGTPDVPKYVLVAAEACVQCGEFSVLVPGKRSGEYWNAATAAAHALQQSKPLPAGAAGPWEFLGEEPQLVSAECLRALPRDPCWGSDYVDYTRLAPLAPAPAPSPPTVQQTPSPAPPAVPTSTLSDLSGFVGTWRAHTGVIDVHDDGSVQWTSQTPGESANTLTLQFRTVTQTDQGAVASAEVGSDGSPHSAVGEVITFTLNGDGTLTPALNGVELFTYCDPPTQAAGVCGA